jgi:hypothetical protein
MTPIFSQIITKITLGVIRVILTKPSHYYSHKIEFAFKSLQELNKRRMSILNHWIVMLYKSKDAPAIHYTSRSLSSPNFDSILFFLMLLLNFVTTFMIF